MKRYEKPQVDLILFDSDVITTSNPRPEPDPDELPIVHGIEEPFQ